MYLYYYLIRNEIDREVLFRRSLSEYMKTTDLALNTGDAYSAVVALGKYGKPYLPSFPEVQFSISHSGDCWGCLFSGSNVGLDIETTTSGRYAIAVEHVMPETHRSVSQEQKKSRGENPAINDRQRQLLKIAERFFAVDEIGFIKKSPDDKALVKNFFFIWTRKEAYIKYTGRGLGAGLNSFSVLSGAVAMGVAFESVDLGGDMVTGCCYMRGSSASGSITLCHLD